MTESALAAAVLLAPGTSPSFPSRHPRLTHRILGWTLLRYVVEQVRMLHPRRVLLISGQPLAAYQECVPEGVEFFGGVGGESALDVAAAALEGEAGPVVLQSGSLLWDGIADCSAMLQATRLDGRARALTLDESVYSLLTVARGAELSGRTIAVDEGTGEFDLHDAADEPLFYRPTATHLRITSRAGLAAAHRQIGAAIHARWMNAGVTIVDPSSTQIGPEVTLGVDTILHPHTLLEGATSIGEGCEVGPFTRIADCRMGDGVRVQFAVLSGSEVGSGARVGPFAQLRPGTRVGSRAKIGNFVELKNANIGDQVSVGHLAYLGDAEVGEGTNIGAGTITCNYDGHRKHRTRIGKKVFVGSHATLVAPVTLGDGSFVAAGTVVTHDVAADALAVGRSRQVSREGWAKRRRESQESGSCETTT